MTKKNKTGIIYRIYFFGRGFVVIAADDDVSYVERDNVQWVHVARSTTIRDWGTDKGIGQLASGPPRSGTVLDALDCALEIPVPAVHMILECKGNEEAWTKEIKKASVELLK